MLSPRQQIIARLASKRVPDANRAMFDSIITDACAVRDDQG